MSRQKQISNDQTILGTNDNMIDRSDDNDSPDDSNKEQFEQVDSTVEEINPIDVNAGGQIGIPSTGKLPVSKSSVLVKPTGVDE